MFKASRAMNWLKRSRLPQANALFPLTYSDDPNKRGPDHFAFADDPRMLDLTADLDTLLTDRFPMDVRPSGFAGPSAVPGAFHALRNVSGYGMDPLPLPLINNAKFIDSLGLEKSIRKADVPYFKETIRLYFGHAAPAPLYLRKQASSGFPWFTSNLE